MPFDLTIVTPEGQAFHGPAESVALPGTEGDFGVLGGHEAFLTGRRIGPATVDAEGRTLYAALNGGYAEVSDDRVVVLSSTCEFAHEIDRERAEVARERATRQLEEMRATTNGEELYQKYQAAYSRAITRIAVSEKLKK